LTPKQAEVQSLRKRSREGDALPPRATSDPHTSLSLVFDSRHTVQLPSPPLDSPEEVKLEPIPDDDVFRAKKKRLRLDGKKEVIDLTLD
jgi:hypothetical protein